MSASACERCRSPLEPGDLRCAVCGQTAPAEVGAARAVHRSQVLRCDGCSAAVSFDVAVGAPRCAFCGAVTHVEERVDPLEEPTDFLPFTVGTDEARVALRGWIDGLGFYRPPDLRSEATVESLQPLWWVGWMFRARALVSWTADSEVGARKADWAPHAGQTELVFDRVVVPASRGLLPRETDALVPHYALDTSARTAVGPSDATVEAFDTTRSGARQRIAEVIGEFARERVAKEHVPGTRKRNVHAAVLLEGLETRRVALPAFVLAYRYKERLYRAVVHGQDATKVLGRAPVAWLRVAGVTLGVAAGLGAVLYLLLAVV
jgi:hypothetical protein